MSDTPQRVLVIGFGNPGRRDDGLGPALVRELEALDLPGVTLDADYQLTVEDGAAAAEADAVVFVDAACNGPAPFSFTPLEPGDARSFSTHSVQPAGVLAIARDLFGKTPAAYILGIRGYEFNEFGEGLSAAASENLAAASAFFAPILQSRTFDAGVARALEYSAATPAGEH